MLTKDAILGMDDLPLKAVDIPEWGGTVYVRAIRGEERLEFERLITGDINLPALAALYAVDEHGERMFSDDDIPALAKKNASALMRIFTAAMLLNGLGAEGAEAAGND
jgi:hypothetical protein